MASFFVSRVDAAVDRKLEALAKPNSRAQSPSQTPKWPTHVFGRFSAARDGRSWSRLARACSARCGPAPAPKTRAILTRSTWIAHRDGHGQHRASGHAGRLPQPRPWRTVETGWTSPGATGTAGRTGDRPGRNHPEAPGRRRRGFREVLRKADGQHRREARKARGDRQPLTAGLGARQASVDAALEQMAQHNGMMARIWERITPSGSRNRRKSPTAWAGCTSPTRCWLTFRRWRMLADAVRADGYTNALLLGMGGSSLAPEVFRKTFGVKDATSTSPCSTAPIRGPSWHTERLDSAKTLFIIATKSGGTTETLSFFKYFYNRVGSRRGRSRASTSSRSPTRAASWSISRGYNFRQIFLNDPNIGGRYSALSYFGLLPAALGRRGLSQAASAVPSPWPARTVRALIGRDYGHAGGPAVTK